MKMFSRFAEKQITNRIQARFKHVNISNHYPEDVLAAYYNQAKPHDFLSAIRYNPEKKMSSSEARKILDNNGANITSLKGMAINMKFTHPAIDDTEYNKIHGESSSEAALAVLQNHPKKEDPPSSTSDRADLLGSWDRHRRHLLPNPYLERHAFTNFSYVANKNISDDHDSVLILIRNMLLKIDTPTAIELNKKIHHFIYDNDGAGKDILTATREEIIALFLDILKTIPGSITDYSDRYVAKCRLETLAMHFGIPGLFKDALEDMQASEKNDHAATQQAELPQEPDNTVNDTAQVKANINIAKTFNDLESQLVRSKIEEFKASQAYAIAYMLGKQDAENAQKFKKNDQRHKKSSGSQRIMWMTIGGTTATALLYALIQNIVDERMPKPKKKTTNDVPRVIEKADAAPSVDEAQVNLNKKLAAAIEAAVSNRFQDNTLLEKVYFLLNQGAVLPPIPEDEGKFSFKRQFLLHLDDRQKHSECTKNIPPKGLPQTGFFNSHLKETKSTEIDASMLNQFS